MTSEVTFKVKVQGQTQNSIKSRNSNMRKLQSVHMGVNQCCDSNETNTNDLRGHLQGQSRIFIYFKPEPLQNNENMTMTW